MRVGVNKQDQGGRHHQLIGDRIQEFSKPRRLTHTPRDVAVKQVRDGRQTEKNARQWPGKITVLIADIAKKTPYNQWNRGNANPGQDIRNVCFQYGQPCSGTTFEMQSCYKWLPPSCD